MLLWFVSHNLIHYLTFRSIMAALTALIIALAIGPIMIRKLTHLKIGQTVRDDGPQSHLSKTGTPTMGGLLMIISITLSTFIWADLTSHRVWILLGTLWAFGAIGFVDDYKKMLHKDSKGLASRWKYFWQSIVGLLLAAILYYTAQSGAETALIAPFFKDFSWPMGLLFIPFVYLVVVGSSNAVNLTDGLDGLAIVPTILCAGVLAVFAYVLGHAKFAGYLHYPHIDYLGEVVVFCAAMVGAGLGFLWFNAYPAEVFMGDVGSLSLGAVLGVLAVMARQELLLVIMGGIFVIETLSVMIQVGSYKTRGKRVFKMAPIHHHFELKGWPETKVIVRFWIISVVLVLISLATLKIR